MRWRGVVGLSLNKVLRVYKQEGLKGVWTRIKQRFIVKSSLYQNDLEKIQEDMAQGEPVNFLLTPMTEALFQRMVEVYGDEISPEKKQMLWDRLDEQSTDRAYLLVEKDGPILGFYCVSYGDNLDTETNYVVKGVPGAAFLFDAYTFEAQRKRGAQKYAVIELLKMMKQKGFATVTVMIDNTNVYSQKGTLPYGFYKTGEVTHINLKIWKGNIERKYDRHDR